MSQMHAKFSFLGYIQKRLDQNVVNVFVSNVEINNIKIISLHFEFDENQSSNLISSNLQFEDLTQTILAIALGCVIVFFRIAEHF